ncbi:MAG TPA: hypothetical protein VIY48_08480 [Candidatus Paceibacterota bacterium]
MYVAKTNEVETFWSSYRCDDLNCPGSRRTKRRKGLGESQSRSVVRPKEIQAWLDESNRDSPTYTKHSPTYWNDQKPETWDGWDNPDTGKPEKVR